MPESMTCARPSSVPGQSASVSERSPRSRKASKAARRIRQDLPILSHGRLPSRHQRQIVTNRAHPQIPSDVFGIQQFLVQKSLLHFLPLYGRRVPPSQTNSPHFTVLELSKLYKKHGREKNGPKSVEGLHQKMQTLHRQR